VQRQPLVQRRESNSSDDDATGMHDLRPLDEASEIVFNHATQEHTCIQQERQLSGYYLSRNEPAVAFLLRIAQLAGTATGVDGAASAKLAAQTSVLQQMAFEVLRRVPVVEAPVRRLIATHCADVPNGDALLMRMMQTTDNAADPICVRQFCRYLAGIECCASLCYTLMALHAFIAPNGRWALMPTSAATSALRITPASSRSTASTNRPNRETIDGASELIDDDNDVVAADSSTVMLADDDDEDIEAETEEEDEPITRALLTRAQLFVVFGPEALLALLVDDSGGVVDRLVAMHVSMRQVAVEAILACAKVGCACAHTHFYYSVNCTPKLRCIARLKNARTFA
jgi:hypothetical protein